MHPKRIYLFSDVVLHSLFSQYVAQAKQKQKQSKNEMKSFSMKLRAERDVDDGCDGRETKSWDAKRLFIPLTCVASEYGVLELELTSWDPNNGVIRSSIIFIPLNSVFLLCFLFFFSFLILFSIWLVSNKKPWAFPTIFLFNSSHAIWYA